jgi:hypothetical protein
LRPGKLRDAGIWCGYRIHSLRANFHVSVIFELGSEVELEFGHHEPMFDVLELEPGIHWHHDVNWIQVGLLVGWAGLLFRKRAPFPYAENLPLLLLVNKSSLSAS